MPEDWNGCVSFPTIIQNMEDVSIQPDAETHVAIIREAAPSALCR